MSSSSFRVENSCSFRRDILCSSLVSGILSITESDTSVVKPSVLVLLVSASDRLALASISVSDFSPKLGISGTEFDRWMLGAGESVRYRLPAFVRVSSNGVCRIECAVTLSVCPSVFAIGVDDESSAFPENNSDIELLLPVSTFSAALLGAWWCGLEELV